LSTQGGGQYLARHLLLGNQVYNADGKTIGDIEDLILNSNNQIEGVVMGTGGFAGFGEKRVAVVLYALQIKNDSGRVTITCRRPRKRCSTRSSRSSAPRRRSRSSTAPSQRRRS
jgi:sporulation protein YlmC with PRC-barrel domain